MSIVTVDLDVSLSNEDLRQLLLDMWLVQCTPMLARFPECSCIKDLRASQELTALCHRMTDLGLVALFFERHPEPWRENLFTAVELYAVGRNRETRVVAKHFPEIRETMLRQARSILEAS